MHCDVVMRSKPWRPPCLAEEEAVHTVGRPTRKRQPEPQLPEDPAPPVPPREDEPPNASKPPKHSKHDAPMEPPDPDPDEEPHIDPVQ